MEYLYLELEPPLPPEKKPEKADELENQKTKFEVDLSIKTFEIDIS